MTLCWCPLCVAWSKAQCVHLGSLHLFCLMQVPKLLSDAKAERVALDQKRAALTQPTGTVSNVASDDSRNAAAAAGGQGSDPLPSSTAPEKAPLLYQLQLQGEKEKEVRLTASASSDASPIT